MRTKLFNVNITFILIRNKQTNIVMLLILFLLAGVCPLFLTLMLGVFKTEQIQKKNRKLNQSKRKPQYKKNTN